MIDIVEIQIVEQGPAGPAGLYPKAQWDAALVPYVRATVLSHNGSVWLALRDTSIEPSAAAPDDWAAWLNLGNVATLDGTGKVPAGQLPAIAITDAFEAASQAAMLALAAQRGDIAIRGDLNKTFVLAADDATVLANWKELLTPTDAVLSVAGLTGAVGAGALKVALAISAADVAGLGALATLNAGAGLTAGAGNLSANVASVAGRTGAVTLAQADIAGLTTADTPTFNGMTLNANMTKATAEFGTYGANAIMGYGADAVLLASGGLLNVKGFTFSSNPRTVGPDVVFSREEAQTLGISNGVNATKLSVYGTITSTTDFERVSLDPGKTTANVHRLMAEKGSVGGALRPIAVDGYAKAGAMVAADIPAGSFALFKDTAGGGVVLGYNDGGILKTVTLT